MNLYRYIALLAMVFIVACKQQAKENTTSTDSSFRKPFTDTTSSLRKDSTTRLYWEQLPIRTVAHLILIDSIRPVASPVIYNMLDSLASESKQSRQFYFKVFNKVMNKADGELAESVGGYAMTYVQNYPKEFLENSATFSNNQLEAWAGNIGIELFLASGENVKDAYDHLVVLLNDNCINCNSSHRKRLRHFNDMIWQTVRENRQALQ